MKRALTLNTNPTGLGAAAGTIYAAAVMVYNAVNHHGVINPEVIIAAVGAAAFLYSRFLVTPVADPKDGDGQPLVTATPAPPAPPAPPAA